MEKGERAREQEKQQYIQETSCVKHFDDFGDDRQILWRHFDPNIEGRDKLGTHFLARIRADVRVGL